MDEADRFEALQLLTDDECRRVFELIPLWRVLQEMSAEEIVQLFGEMNDA